MLMKFSWLLLATYIAIASSIFLYIVKYELTALLITNGLKGVVCVDHIKVRCNYLNSSYSLIQININVLILSLQACIVG